jgi:branched-chain amino acid transport system ATP-binding protein
VLEIENVTAGYGDTMVLRDVTLSVPDAKVVALLGPNGAGKTTTLRVASGLIRPMRGRVVLAGEELTGCRPSVMARHGLCLLPEGRGIFPSLSVRENLILQSPKHKEAESIERAVAAFPELGRRLHQFAGSLSGGEQQMLALVRTIVTDPKIVLVDEASLGLAPLVVDRVFETVRRIAAAGASILLVEQYVTRALDLADWVYVMSRGQIVSSRAAQDLAPEDVFEQYLGIDVGTPTVEGS